MGKSLPRVLVAAVLVAGAGLGLVSRSGTGSAAVAPVPGGVSTVTLLTGDRVALADPRGSQLSVRPGAGRAGMRFVVQRVGGSVYVLPRDALAPVRDGFVDRRLFDVAGLLRDGFRDRAPLVVREGAGASTRRVGSSGALWPAVIKGKIRNIRLDEPLRTGHTPVPDATAASPGVGSPGAGSPGAGSPGVASPGVASPVGAGSHVLTITLVGLDGAPATDAFAQVTGWDEYEADWPVVNPDGTAAVRLPEGRYNLGAFVDDAVLTAPVVDLTHDLSVTLDARAAGPVSVTVPEPSAGMGFVQAGYDFYPSYQSYPAGLLIMGDAADGVRLGQAGKPAAPDKLIGSVQAQWAKPDGAGDFTASPYLYAVAQAFPGRVPNGFARDYRPGDFAEVRQRLAAGDRTVYPAHVPWISTAALIVPTPRPGTRVEYLAGAGGVRWTSEIWSAGRLYQQPTAYRAGRVQHDEWGAGPLGPALGQEGPEPWEWAGRTGDEIAVLLPLYGDRAGHPGTHMPTTTSRTALYRDGALVAEYPLSGRGQFTVPPEDAGYRLEVADTRDDAGLTTRLTAAWTFRSAHARQGRLPLAAVRFTPAVENARAGRAFDIPVTVEGQPGVPASAVTSLSVEASYDDGVTWRPAAVRARGDGWTATVRHPAGDGFVSLRASAAGAAGDTVTETIIRAYRLTV